MVSFNLLLSGKNYNKNTGELVYRLPSGVQFSGMECSLNTLSVYNSFWNVAAEYGNNTITIKIPIFSAANVYVMNTYVCVLPDGKYDFAGMNDAINNACLNAGLYLLDSSGKVVVFQQITDNRVTYSNELYTYYIPTAAQASALGMTNPGGLSILNSGNKQVCAQVVITQPNQQRLTGFGVGTYPPAPLESTAVTWSNTAAYTAYSTTTPEVNRVNGIVLGCNVIANQYTIPNSLLSLVPLTAKYGGSQTYSPPSPMWTACSATSIQELSIQFYDQDLNRLYLRDTELALTISFRDRAV